MLRENLKDSAEILQTIFNQPLSIPGHPENMSLLQAIQSFTSQQPEHSDLSKMVRLFGANKEPLERLIQELHLIAHDLTVS